LLSSFRNSYYPRIAVTVDMIATGTDIKPLEIVFFMRDVQSANYFEQMKGRGCRVMKPAEFQSVTPGAVNKERYVIVDAVGVTEHIRKDSPPLERQPTIPLKAVLGAVGAGVAALRRAQSNLKRYRASVLKAACEGRLVPTEAELARQEGRTYETGAQLLARILEERRTSWSGKGKYKDPTPPDTTKLPELPEGWTWATPAQLGDVQLGRQRSPKNISNEYPTKYIRAANITAQGLDLSDVLEMEFRPAERERFTLKPGDLVLSEASGSAAQVGKPALWEEHHPPHCFQNTVIRLFSRVAGGVGINHLSADKFASLVLALPTLAEQERIVADVERRLSVTDALESAFAASLRRSLVVRQAILHTAFSRSGTK
jgi:type I restriction enzyme S subunit